MAETWSQSDDSKSAINKLVEQGYLIRKPEQGTYVAQSNYKRLICHIWMRSQETQV